MPIAIGVACQLSMAAQGQRSLALGHGPVMRQATATTDRMRLRAVGSPHWRTFTNNLRTGAPASLCAMTAYCRKGTQRLFPKFDSTGLMVNT